MNFRKLLTYLTVGTAAVIPFAGAQNPTILQGSYISNVFGNSNFVKNPNAQTNVANVTNATRSTTTPLVATSEFNLSLDAGQNATWTLRTFDAGMKGQNCEARFSYRGFATATTTAEIVQNSLVVAQLVLTPSTDPRIASINFPCGDLANATTFRIAQTTANMTGTNEIGGVYTGLATNMANVAQAEFVGGYRTTATTTTPSNTSGTLSNLSGGSFTATLLEKATSYDAASGSVTFSYLPAGTYQVVLSAMIYPNTLNQACRVALKEDTSGDLRSNTYQSSGATTASSTSSIVGTFSFTSGASRTFRVQTALAGTGSCIMEFNSGGIQSGISVYRFPTSSELVVTPERQNTFAGIKGVATANTNSVTSASWTKLTAGSTLTRTSYGKAKVESNDDYSITIENLPVGSYYVTTTAFYAALSSASGDQTSCFFALADSATGGAQIGSMQANATGDATLTVQTGPASTIGGIYTNTSVANRTFFVQAYRSGGGGSCVSYSDSNRPVTISVIPLDQPSNSALYVEGPVLAAATGAAIPAGYQGEKKTSTVAYAGPTTTGTTLSSLTLEPGLWFISFSAASVYGSGSVSLVDYAVRLTTNNALNPITSDFYTFPADTIGFGNSTAVSTTQVTGNPSKTILINVTSTQVYYLRMALTVTGGGSVGVKSYMEAIRLN